MINRVLRVMSVIVRVVVWAWVAFAATVSYVAIAWNPPARHDVAIVPGAPEGWFDPTYHVRGLPKQWQIGRHSYSTRDLMGRNISYKGVTNE